jgi:hypothetical protein
MQNQLKYRPHEFQNRSREKKNNKNNNCIKNTKKFVVENKKKSVKEKIKI